MISLEQLKVQVGASDIHDQDEAIQRLLDTAVVLVDSYVGASVVPAELLDLCYLRVAEQLFEQSSLKSGSGSNFYETAEAPAAVNRNPMSSVYHLLRGWVIPW